MTDDASNDADELEAKIKAIQASFAGKLTGKVAELKQAVTDFNSADTQEKAGDAKQTINMLSHTLAGAAPTFGFPEIGDIAADIEALTMPDQKPDENLNALIQKLEDLLP